MPLRADIADPLWVPLLTHYDPDGSVDPARMLAHWKSLAPHLSQVMLAGSTGDGWELDDAAFDALIEFGARDDLPEGAALLFGALRPTTADVLDRIARLEQRMAELPLLRERTRGVVVCPPVDAAAGQDAILRHYEAVLDASTLPIATYQLPQITGCEIAPETLAALSAHSRITMFKDSSGEDRVARDRDDYGGIVMVRGAEGGYLEALEGSYHGWLLSTGNALAEPLRRLLALREAGDVEAARELSARLSRVVDAVFAAAADEPGANAFSNANRAMDHLRAYGQGWREGVRARKVDGAQLSEDLIARAEVAIRELMVLKEDGYISAT